mmetsp:Transcript_967/g.2010  ORF Transcript_967/g.2010 Transcript_967/m.2010 type:complete len:85 (+) Transcript_967:793-1047(+)
MHQGQVPTRIVQYMFYVTNKCVAAWCAITVKEPSFLTNQCISRRINNLHELSNFVRCRQPAIQGMAHICACMTALMLAVNPRPL